MFFDFWLGPEITTRPVALTSLKNMSPPTRLSLDVDSVNAFDISKIFLKILVGFSDADWAMDFRHRRSISGIVFLLAGGAISWKCRVQPTVALSTAESEFLAASDSGKQAIYLRSILDDLGLPMSDPTSIYEDNRAAKLISKAAAPTRQTRHIEIRHFAILYWAETDEIRLIEIDGTRNPADLLTKQVARVLLHRHLDVISGIASYIWHYPVPGSVPVSTSGADSSI